MKASAHENALLDGYKVVQVKPNLYHIDVLGDREQEGGTNSEWRRLGELIVQRIVTHQQRAVLVSTLNLEEYLDDRDVTKYGLYLDRTNADNSASFKHEGKRYMVTCLEQTRLEHVLPCIVECSEFVFGLNVWLCFFGAAAETSARELCKDENTTFVRDMRCVIDLEYLDVPTEVELIAGIADGLDMMWLNPRI